MQPIFSSYFPISVSPDDPKPAQTTFIIIIIISVSISPPLPSLLQDIPLLFSPLPHRSRYRRRLGCQRQRCAIYIQFAKTTYRFLIIIFFLQAKSDRRPVQIVGVKRAFGLIYFFLTKKMFAVTFDARLMNMVYKSIVYNLF